MIIIIHNAPFIRAWRFVCRWILPLIGAVIVQVIARLIALSAEGEHQFTFYMGSFSGIVMMLIWQAAIILNREK